MTLRNKVEKIVVAIASTAFDDGWADKYTDGFTEEIFDAVVEEIEKKITRKKVAVTNQYGLEFWGQKDYVNKGYNQCRSEVLNVLKTIDKAGE